MTAIATILIAALLAGGVWLIFAGLLHIVEAELTADDGSALRTSHLVRLGAASIWLGLMLFVAGAIALARIM